MVEFGSLGVLRCCRSRYLAYLAVLLLLVSSFLMIGCGGGGVGGGGQSTVATGMVTLPAGFTGKASSYFVAAEGDHQPVSANGAFKLTIPTQGETLVSLLDASGNVVMVGFADSASSGTTEAGGHGQITPATTATALLFYGVAGYILPSDSWSQLTAYIAASPQCAHLSGVIAGRLAVNPSALSSSDPQIQSALVSDSAGLAAGHVVPQSLRGSMPQSAENASTTVQVIRNSATRDATPGNLILIQDGGEKSGVEVLNNPSGDGIVFMNHFRRRCAAFIYETAKQAPGGKLMDIPPVVQPFSQTSLTSTIGNALAMGFGPGDMLDIQASNALHGTVGSIIDAAFNSSAFTQSPTGPILLKQDGNSVRTDYTIVVVGPSATDDLSKFTPLQAFPQIRQEWQNAIKVLNWEEAILDIFIPVVASVPLSPKFKPLGKDPGPILDIINASSNIPDLVTQVTNGRFKDATNTLLQNTIDAGAVREKILSALWTSTFGAGTFLERIKIAEQELESFFSLLNKLDFALQLIDSSTVVKDSANSDAGQSWTGSVVPVKVILSPNPATVNSVQNIATLSAQIIGEPDLSQFRFKWSTTGVQGSLEEPNSSIAMPPGPTTFSQVAYVADLLKIKAGQSDTVTVTVYNVSDINSPIGTTSAQVLAQPGMELGTYDLDNSDDFIGLVANDPWVKSAVATVPLVSGATQYTVELKDSIGNVLQFYYIDASGNVPLVLDSNKKPYDHNLLGGGVVKIAAFGVDAVNAAVSGADGIVMGRFPVARVEIYYQ